MTTQMILTWVLVTAVVLCVMVECFTGGRGA